MTSRRPNAEIAPSRPRLRVWHVSTALLVLGCGLLLVAVLRAILERPRQAPPAQTLASSVDVRARFSGISPSGQSTGFGVAPDGSLAIVDRGRQRVIRLDASGAPLAEWGPRFEPDADALDLSGMAASGSDWYLLDRGRARILQLDPNGHAIRSIDIQSLATYGPNGLGVDARGDIYLADTGGSRILVFSPGGSLVRTVGTAGTGLGQLKQPVALSFAPDGAMFVSDVEANRIQRFDAGRQATNAWPLAGHAWGVAVDGLGRVFVPDPNHDLVRMFSAQGDVLAEVGGQPPGSLGVRSPTQVGLAPDGSALWVLGDDGLARVDLSALSQVTPAAGSRGASIPIAVAGALLAALGLVPLARRSAARPGAGPQTASLTEGATSPEPPDWLGLGAAAPATELPTPQQGGPVPAEASSLPGRGAAASARAELLAASGRLVLAFGILLIGLGGAGGVLAQIHLADPTAKIAPWPALGLEIASGLVWAAGYRVSARALPFGWVADWPAGLISATPRLAFNRSRALTAGAASVLGGLAAGMWYVGRFETADATRAMLVWLFAVALAVIACSRAAFRRPKRPPLLALIPLLLFLLALAPRLWQVADVPYGIWYDEAQGALEVRRIVQQGTYTPILDTYGKDASGVFFLITGLALFLGDGILAARSAAAVVGALAVPATYLLGRELFGWRVGLAAALVLACMRWQIDLSRLGMNPGSLLPFATTAFWLLARAVRRQLWSDFVWAGLALGLGLHAYVGYRGIPPVAVVGLVLAAILFRWPPAKVASRLGVYLAAGLLTALPVLIFAVKDPVTFNGRTAQTLILTSGADGAEKVQQIWDSLQRHVLMFNVSGDLNGRHNLPGAPMLDPITAALVALGLGWLLLRLRDWRTLLLLAWATLAMSGGILTLAFEAPQAVRTLGVTPVLALLGGIGLIASLDRLLAVVTLAPPVRAQRAALATAGLGALAIGSIGWSNLDTFFNRQMRDGAVFESFSTRETVPARAALVEQGRHATILASTTMTPSVQAAFLVPDLQATIRQFDPAGDLPYRGPGPGLVFLETEHDQALADEVARMYPDAIRQPVQAPSGGTPIVQGFRLEPDVLTAHRGVQATYRDSDGTPVMRSEARPEFDLTLAEPPVALPADVSWQAGLALELTGEYGFGVPSGFELRIDDQLLAPAARAGVRVRLVRGNHVVRLSGRVGPATQARLEWRTPDATQWQPIAADALFAQPPGGLGLRLTLWAGLDAGAQPVEEFVDPVLSHYYHVTPFSRLHLEPRVWAAEWVGQLDAPEQGRYAFSLDHSQTAAVWIDNRQVLGNLSGTPDTRNSILDLTRGRHAIRVRYEKTVDGSPWIRLSWTPPGGLPTVVPGSALFAPPPEVLGSAR